MELVCVTSMLSLISELVTSFWASLYEGITSDGISSFMYCRTSGESCILRLIFRPLMPQIGELRNGEIPGD